MATPPGLGKHINTCFFFFSSQKSVNSVQHLWKVAVEEGPSEGPGAAGVQLLAPGEGN